MAEVFELYSMNLDGSNILKINGTMTPNANARVFQNTPNYLVSQVNDRVYFMADKTIDESFDLYTVKPDGTGLALLNNTTHSLELSGLQLSPDENKLCYILDMDTPRQSELYCMDPDGANRFKVNAPLVSNGEVYHYTFLPDSSGLVYAADQEINGSVELYKYTFADHKIKKIFDDMTIYRSVSYYKISPDGKKILIENNLFGNDEKKSAVYVRDL